MLNRKLTNYYPVKWSKCSAVFYKRNICQTIKRYFQSNLMITEVAQICHESMFTSPSANSIQLNSFRLPVNSNFHSTIKSEFLITTDAFAIIFPSYEIHDTEFFWEVNAWHISHKKSVQLIQSERHIQSIRFCGINFSWNIILFGLFAKNILEE